MNETLTGGVGRAGAGLIDGADTPFDPRSLLVRQDLEAPALRQVSLMVRDKGGVNLSQGTCLLPVPDVVVEGAAEAMRAGENRYSPADGIPRLRQALTGKLRAFNGIECQVDQVAVTCGSTGALESICTAFLNPGDEVVLFEPSYPYHRDAFEHRYKARVRTVPLRAPDWTFDVDGFARAVTPRT